MRHLALILLLLLSTAPAGAQWHGLRPPPAASWWAIPPCEEPPAVVVVGGAGGAHCAPDGGVGIVWAQGEWVRVDVDGRWFAGAGRVWLVEVAR